MIKYPILFTGIAGSVASGLKTKSSDRDIRGVFIQPNDEILVGNHIPQINLRGNDEMYYEVGRFIDLLCEGNPNILEILNLPPSCIMNKSTVFELILEQRDMFLTKQLKDTFSNYALGQIKKAKSLNKMINWDKNKVTRKDVLDFCYILGEGESSKSFDQVYGKDKQEKLSLAKVNNFPGIYSMYFTDNGGIVSKGENESNEVQVRSIPKDAIHIGYLRFDKNGYSQHCKDYKRYQEWLQNRNEVRYNTNKKHGQGYDSKNMSICFKLLFMAKDIALGKGIVVDRSKERDFLLSIKKGDWIYEELLDMAEKQISEISSLFEESDLPLTVDRKKANEILLEIRWMRG